MGTNDKRQSSVPLLSTTHELNDFQLCAGVQNRLRPERLLDNPALQLYCQARRVQFQLPDQAQDRLPFRGCLGFSVYRNLNHVWLTPLFSNHYSQIWLKSQRGTLMPKSYTELYFPILLQAIIAMGLAAGLLTASYLLGKKVRNRFKDMPYESGIVPTGDARHRFSVKFYLVGMLFILFDIEAIFLYPWVVVYRDLKMFGFYEMLVFVVLILSGFFYIWKKGALDWAETGRSGRK